MSYVDAVMELLVAAGGLWICLVSFLIGWIIQERRCARAAIKDDPPAWWERLKIMAEARAKAALVKEGKP